MNAHCTEGLLVIDSRVLHICLVRYHHRVCSANLTQCFVSVQCFFTTELCTDTWTTSAWQTVVGTRSCDHRPRLRPNIYSLQSTADSLSAPLPLLQAIVNQITIHTVQCLLHVI